MLDYKIKTKIFSEQCLVESFILFHVIVNFLCKYLKENVSMFVKSMEEYPLE